jgi:alpha-tubulin suppressor-like RCC1 family protein
MGSYVNIGNNVSIDNSGTLPKLSFTPVNDLGLDSVIFVDIPDGSITKMDGTSLSPTSWTFTTENVFKYWIAGENTYGELGQNNRTHYSSPVQLTSTAWSAINSSHYSSLGRKPAGTLWSWGYQSNVGELGHNEHANTHNKSSPTQIPGTTWSKSVAVGAAVMAATRTDGTLWMWGAGSNGQLGQNTSGTPAHRSSPVQVGSDTTWPTGIDKIASGYYTHAIKTDGTLWAWGRDWEFGMSGLNFIGNRSSPTQIPGTTWSTVVAGYYVVSALKTDGTLWMWGQSGSGSLGDNSRTSRSSPIQVPGTWSSHSTTHMGGGSGAIKTDGTLWMWGDNSVGTLGQNDVVAQSSPVQVPGTTWSRITQAAENSFVVTKTDGTAWVWGQNEHGMLGQNNLTKYSSPVQIPGTTWQYNLNSGAFLAIGKP